MKTVRIETRIRAPLARCFDLARSIDVHIDSTKGTEERAVAGRTSGLMDLGEEVTWEARHFGVLQRLTSRMVAFDRPRHFRDSQVEGAFRSFDHDHFFASDPVDPEVTLMTDVFAFAAPLGPLGWVAERLFLNAYLTRFLTVRAEVIKRVAEAPDHARFLGGWRYEVGKELERCDRGDPAFREAARLVRAEIEALPCECLAPSTSSGFDVRALGSDGDDADLTLHTCQTCRRVWVHWFYEDHIHDTSGRWYRGIVDAGRAAPLDADAATSMLRALPWKLCGGSFFSGRRYITADKDRL